MSPTHIARFFALVGVGCVVQPIFAQSATADPNAESHAEGRHSAENAVRQEEELILAVLRGVEAAFSDADLPRYLSFFYSSYLIMAPAGVIAPSSEDEALTLLRPHMENLRVRGYARSELKKATVKVLSATTALAAVEWIRRKANEDELERLGATYAFFKNEYGWKIVMVTVYPPGTLVKLK